MKTSLFDYSAVYDDIETDLEWLAGPDKDTNLGKAKEWIKKLSENGEGWRMPGVEEIKSLYSKGEGICNMTPLLKTSGWYVWSCSTKNLSSAWAINFHTGYQYLNSDISGYCRNHRVFAVRFHKQTLGGKKYAFQ